jgi:two-component system LytT family sensor kinase
MAPGSVRTSRVVALELVVGAFFIAQTVLDDLIIGGESVHAARHIAVDLLYWVVWAFLTPVVLVTVRRWPLDTRPAYRPLLVHVAICAILAAVQTFTTFGLQSLVLWLFFGASSAREALSHLVSSRAIVWSMSTGVSFYWVIVVVHTALRFRGLYVAERLSAAELAQRSAALEAELTQSKLDALRSQLRPHFLFNTLNTISVLVGNDAGKAKHMLLRLSSLLRRSLDEEAHEVSLQQELAFLNDYLDIQRVRFGGRLTVRLAVDPSVFNARVPVFLLQPLMENAIEHGGSENRSMTVELSAGRAGKMLYVTLEDDGPGVGDAALVQEGIGLRNTRARLHQLYGPSATVALRAARDTPGAAGARVDIWIPFSPVPA